MIQTRGWCSRNIITRMLSHNCHCFVTFRNFEHLSYTQLHVKVTLVLVTSTSRLELPSGFGTFFLKSVDRLFSIRTLDVLVLNPTVKSVWPHTPLHKRTVYHFRSPFYFFYFSSSTPSSEHKSYTPNLEEVETCTSEGKGEERDEWDNVNLISRNHHVCYCQNGFEEHAKESRLVALIWMRNNSAWTLGLICLNWFRFPLFAIYIKWHRKIMNYHVFSRQDRMTAVWWDNPSPPLTKQLFLI